LVSWTIWALCVALVALTGLLAYLTPSLPERFESYWLFPTLGVLPAVLSLAYPTVGALIISRHPRNPIGWLFCAAGFVVIGLSFATAYADYAIFARSSPALPATQYMAWLADRDILSTAPYYLGQRLPEGACSATKEICEWWELSSGVALPAMLVVLTLLLLLFPDGRLPSRKWSVAALTALIGSVLVTLWWTTEPGPLFFYPSIDNPFGIKGDIRHVVEGWGKVGWLISWASLIAAGLSWVTRWIQAEGEEHQQMKWFAYSLLLVVFAYPISPQVLLMPALTLLPIAVGIAILKYRLYDIDVIVNRTLVYGAMSACVVGIYVLAVVALGALFQAQGNLAVSLLATGLVAVLFQPLRSRLQRGVNRLMYGERDDPYAVISRLGRHIEAALAPESVLPTIAETIAQALKLPYTAILLKDDEGFRTAAAYGSPAGEPKSLPLIYQREEIGRLVLSPRAPGEGFSDADRILLEDLARQAEVAVHAVRLTSDLQRSRERLVATREEERRRLRRDLHDGLGAQLAGLNVQAGTLRRLIPRDPAAADKLVGELREELRSAIADIRRLVYDLRPPALDDLGLKEALRRLAERHGSEGGQLRVSVEAPEDLPSLPAAVEVAIYRIVQEALTNVARHARARSCVVRLAVDEDVALEIVDDGVGIPKERGAGVGLSSMRERAAELGGSCALEPALKGGTRVLVRLPLPKGGPKE
jgi:signal transduction histidine kinase